ncbi:hypothetical protein [Kutzneria sp. NPDC052558]|uniref:hypothetical protein n=1 Tax=Kutzneria sp. NPDC052558 TaxID=3364121 RepID=UPI0037CBB29B
MRRIITVLALVALTPPAVAYADSTPGTTTLVSFEPDGVTPSHGSSGEPSISADGRFVAFTSDSPGLVPGDTNRATDVFVRDRQTGVTTRVSVSSTGAQADNVSQAPSISGDGRYVVFSSYASNLVPGDTNRRSDVFLHDTQTGTTSKISVGSVGDQANSGSYRPVISTDGLFVAFESDASNLIAHDDNGQSDIFEYSRQWNTLSRVSVDANGLESNGLSWQPSISADGRYVSFASEASNLVLGDTNHYGDVFVHDRLDSRTERVSIGAGGAQGDSVSRFARISGDGRWVVYISYASTLVPGDTNDENDIFLYDRETSTTTRIDLDPAGQQLRHGTTTNIFPAISTDGRFVAYESAMDELVPGDHNYAGDVYLWDRATATTSWASVATDGALGDYGSFEPAFSADGRHLAFASTAKNFVPGVSEFGLSSNVYVRELAG